MSEDNEIAVEEYKVYMILRRLSFLSAAKALFLLLISAVVTFPQQEPLVAEWVQRDIAAVELVGPLVRERPIDPASIAKLINSRNYHDVEDLGFGAGRIEESQGFGYSTIRVSALIFRSSIVRYHISFQSWSSWSRIKGQILKAWEASVPKPYIEIQDGLRIEINDEAVLREYKKAVAVQLGELKEIRVPTHLREDYEYLVSPFENSVVGVHGCGVAGIVPLGKDSVDSIQAAGNSIELLENVLRGYNPGGRIYSLITLRHLKRQGTVFSPSIERTMEKLLTSNLTLDACFGGTIHRLTTKEIINRVESSEK